MRAILINPQDHSITEVDYTGEYRNIYTHIDANCFDIVRIGDDAEHTIFVDDNGLNNGAVQRIGMFRYDGDYPAYLAGKALILATDAEGESVAASLTLDEVRSKVAFGEATRIGGVPVFVEVVNGEGTGRYWPV